jgi:hypothetical protein
MVFLYSHWGGASQETDLGEALGLAEGRWNDDAYGTRIIISRLTKDALESETGYGVYAGMPGRGHGADYDYIYVVDFVKREVQMASNSDDTDVSASMPFDEFVRNPYQMAIDSGLLSLA